MTAQTLELRWKNEELQGKEFVCKTGLSGTPLVEWVKTNVGMNKYFSRQELLNFYGTCLYILDERTKEANDELLPFPEGEEEPYDDHYYGAVNYARSTLKGILETYMYEDHACYFTLVD